MYHRNMVCFRYIALNTLHKSDDDDDDDNNNNNNNNNRKTFDRFTTKDSYTWNITHNTESTAV